MNPPRVVKIHIMLDIEAELRRTNVLLVRIKNLRFPIGIYCRFQRFDTMNSVHCIHYVIRKNFTTEPVDDSYHCRMPGQRRISDVCAPYLIRALYPAFAQKIREFLMFEMRSRGLEMRTRIDRSQNQRFLRHTHMFVICLLLSNISSLTYSPEAVPEIY